MELGENMRLEGFNVLVLLMMLVIAAYYFVRSDDGQWVKRNLEPLTQIAPAAGGGTPSPTGTAPGATGGQSR